MPARLPFVMSVATLSAAFVVPTYGFKITWTGLGDGVDVFDEANWLLATTDEAPPAGTVDPGVEVNLIMEIGEVFFVANASAGDLTLGPTGVLQVTGGELFSSASITRDATPQVDDAANATMIISSSPGLSGSVTAGSLSEINVSLINTLTLTSADDPLMFSTVGFSTLSSSDATLNLTNTSVQAVLDDHLGKLNVGGAAAVVGANPSVAEPGDNLLIVSDGFNGSVLRPVSFVQVIGDANGDGFVGTADVQIVVSNWAPNDTTKTFTQGDFTGDGAVGTADVQQLIQNWNPPPPAAAAVPEPGSLALLVLGGLAGARRRR